LDLGSKNSEFEREDLEEHANLEFVQEIWQCLEENLEGDYEN